MTSSKQKIYRLFRVMIQPTNRCNLNCIFCWRNHRDYDKGMLSKKNELSDKKWLEIVKDACELGTDHLTITGGGEPFIRRDLILKIAKVIKKESLEKDRKIKFDITTNGTLIDRSFIECLIKLGLKDWYLPFTFHGVKENTNDSLMGKKGALKDILKVISFINSYKKEYMSFFPQLSNQFVITKINYMEIKRIIPLVKKYGLGHIDFKILDPHSTSALKHLSFGPNDLYLVNRQIKVARKLASLHKVSLGFQFTTEDLKDNASSKERKCESKTKTKKIFKKDVYCTLPFFSISILPNGSASPCCLYKDNSREGLSDNIRGKSLIDIWRSKKFNTFRTRLLNDDPQNNVYPVFCENHS